MSYSRIAYHLAYVFACFTVVAANYYYARSLSKDPYFPPDFLPTFYVVKAVIARLLIILVVVVVGFIFIGPFALLPMIVFFEKSITTEQIVALLVLGYVTAVVANLQERSRIRDLLQSVRQHGEQLYETSRRVMVAQQLHEEFPDTIRRLRS